MNKTKFKVTFIAGDLDLTRVVTANDIKEAAQKAIEEFGISEHDILKIEAFAVQG